MIKPLFLIAFTVLVTFFTSCKPFQEITITNVESFKLNKITMQAIDGELSLKIKNPNSTGFCIFPSEFDIMYGSMKLGKAKLNKKVRIGRNTEKVYTFNIQSKPENLNLMDIIQLAGNKSNATLQLSGELKAGKFLVRKKYPVNYSNTINLLNN